MLQAYLDESGTKHTEIVTIGGFVSSALRWRRFDKEWSQILKTMSVQYFHMREYAHYRGQFQGWSDARREIIMTKLIPIIRRHVIFKVAVSIDMRAYNRLFPKKLKEAFGDSYYFCFRECVNAIVKRCKQTGVQESVSYTFDENKPLAARAKRIFAGYKNNPNFPDDYHRVGSISYADDKVARRLQAADIMAYEANKFHRGSNRKPFEALSGIPGPLDWWGSFELEHYLAFLRRHDAAKPLLQP